MSSAIGPRTPAGAMLRTVEEALRRGGLADLVGGASSTARPPATAGAAPRHLAPHSSSPNPTSSPAGGTNPTPAQVRPDSIAGRATGKPLKAKQLTAARLLLAGGAVGEVASALRVHRYTVTRWQSDPRFQAELRRQNRAIAARLQAEVGGAAPRHGAPHGATRSPAPARNEAKCACQARAAQRLDGMS